MRESPRSLLKNLAPNADLIPMLATDFRTHRGLTGTLATIVFLLASRVQLDRNQPPGVFGASFDVATHQIATALVAMIIGGLVIVGLRIRHRRSS